MSLIPQRLGVPMMFVFADCELDDERRELRRDGATVHIEPQVFDVLHYLPPAEQRALLSRLTESITPGGLLVIRDCPRDGSFRFWMTWLAEKFAQTICWNLNTPLHFPTRTRINAAFSETKFTREIRPLWGASPFNNHIFIFRPRARSTVPAAE